MKWVWLYKASHTGGSLVPRLLGYFIETLIYSASLVPRPPLTAFFAAVEKKMLRKKVREEAWVRGYYSATSGFKCKACLLFLCSGARR